MNTSHDIWLNSQFIVVIICFSVRFCNSSLLVLKMCFQFFSFVSKKVERVSSDRKILISLLLVSFYLQNCLSFLKIKFLAKIFGETFMSLKSTSFFKELWYKPLIYLAKQTKRNLRQVFLEERQLKTIMPKQSFPEYTFYLFPL